MAILDSLAEFSDAQSILSTAASSNVVDTEVSTGSSFAELGGGTPIWLVVRVNTVFAAATSTSFGFYAQLQDCTASGGTYVTILQGIEQTGTLWVAGDTMLAIPLPSHHRRYLRTRVVSTGCSGSTGNVDAYLALAPPNAILASGR